MSEQPYFQPFENMVVVLITLKQHKLMKNEPSLYICVYILEML